VRSIYTAFERGDFSSTEWAHHEIEYESIGGDLDEPVRVVGVAGMVASYRDFLSAWRTCALRWMSIASSTRSACSS
jgi:hypothetical protein